MAYLVIILTIFVIVFLPSSKKIRLEPARIVSAGVYESEYNLKSRYKVETLGGDIYFIVENANKGRRDIDQIVCLQIRTLRIINSQSAAITRNSRCPETSQ